VIDAKLICCLVETIIQLRKLGHSVILVTSGAVSIGCLRLVRFFSLLPTPEKYLHHRASNQPHT
jgi:glutamate 5-kinase